MTDYQFNERAYAKIIFHAAKYPHLAVNGVLLSEKSPKGNTVQIVDAIPLFHQCLYVTPMAEIALTQVDAFAERENLIVAGYYVAPENLYDSSVEKAPAAKIGEKILETNKNACFVVVDNKLMRLNHTQAALKVFSSSGESARWSKASYTLAQQKITLQTVSELLQRGAMREVVDFDNHLDNPANDWTNQHYNRDLKQLMAMY
ncbi:ER membrane protein complex subunit 8/9 homolog [Bactrocera neohumeralis]|uniref:ER membrane protein complex subunit 8/9 homolog n=1 Tax=Bactrocera tryoni TaxID=59916 RepID=UPI001A995A40|nr:ER membrane protein complex subunit 8/9 homolog [Bactrocera tryoni]XP_050335037.1 ER membrane protein complex subunit 8/9 homolog [Bactrocera neohumeralis]